MTDQAGFTPAGALMVRSGEAFALPLILQNGAGENQDLLGRSFVLSVRLSRASEPFLQVAGVLADDRLSVSFLVSADDATAVYQAGLSRALQGDITEAGGTFRHSFPITVDEGSGVPVDEPISLPNFPVTEMVAMPGATIVVQRGAQGYGAERRLYDAGLIDEPTVAAMDERYALAGAPFADAAAASAASAETDAAAALADADRADLAALAAQSQGDVATNYGVALAATAEGATFRVYADDGTIKTFRKVDSLGVEIFAIEGRIKAAAERGKVSVKAEAYQPGSPPIVIDGKLVLRQAENADGSLTALETIDLLTGRKWAAGEPIQTDGAVTGGCAALLRGLNGEPALAYDVIDRALVSPLGQFTGLSEQPDTGFGRTVEQSEAGERLAAYEVGQFVRFVPRRLDGLTIQADHNKIPQLWQVIEGQNGSAIDRRQITYSQWGVTDYQVISAPNGATPGLIRIFCNDQDLISQRHLVRYAHWYDRTPTQSDPAKIVYFLILGQSNSVGAGSFDNNPTEILGPQTIRTAMPIRYQSFAKSRLLTWNGGTIPHQGNLNGTASDPNFGTAQFVPIDAARITSLVPMVEGLGEVGAHEDGGWRRESLCSSMALHLNGPNGWDGLRYVAAASFGFGSSTFQNLFYDGTDRKTSWLNALDSVTQMQALATAAGLDLEVHVVCDHGEANQSDTTYQDRWEEFLPILQSDIVGITAQSETPQVFLAQTIAARGTFAEPAYSSLAQVRLAEENADIHLLPPFYWSDFEIDKVHYKPTETQLRGALYGEVINDWFQRGQDAALTIESASWTASRITVNFSYPVACDTETVVLSTAGNGLAHTNTAGTTRSITSARIDATDPAKVIIRTSSDIPTDAVEKVRNAYGNQTSAANQTMGWGGAPDGGGQRSQWRRADWTRYSMIDGRPLHIFANIQELDATKEV